MAKNVNMEKPKKPKYRDDIKKAYDIGYSKGWDNAYSVPNRFGTKLAAGFGFMKGFKNRYKADKYTAQYNKLNKQN